MPYCIKCGAPIAEDDRFCTACGAQQFAEKEGPVYAAPKTEYNPADSWQSAYTSSGGQPGGFGAPGGSQTSYGSVPGYGAAPNDSATSSYSATPDYGAAWPGGAVCREAEVSPRRSGKGPVIAVVAVISLLIVLLFGIVGSLLNKAGASAGDTVSGNIISRETSLEAGISLLVQGNIDMLYLGRADQAYFDAIESSAAECEQDYLSGLESEAEFFKNYCDIEYLPDDLKADLVALYKEIYSHSRYTVGEVKKKDANTYTVQVVIYPLNIMQLVKDRVDDGGMDWFYDKYPEDAVDAMTDAAYKDYDKEWAYGLIAIVREQLPKMGYEDAQTLSVQVVRDTDGVWGISDESMSDIDEWIIDYS